MSDSQITATASSRAGDGHRFLTQARVEEIGELVAPLIADDLSWIERRKESVQLLDDSALKRHMSVEFSLRSNVKPLLKGEPGVSEDLFCAPVFVLPKSPSTLMSFDLCDETGHSLALVSRVDNGRISGEALVHLATMILAPTPCPSGLAAEFRRLASADAARAEQIAERLLKGGLAPFDDALATLRAHPRFCQWTQTLAHSSLLVVLFRSSVPRRKLVKLTFQEPMLTKQRALTRYGWASYLVTIDSPLIEARSSHFEAEAPPGLRISKAQLTDSENAQPETEVGFMKRIHLYRQRAERAGAGTAVLWLDVSSPGFVSGALMASTLTLGALLGCLLNAEEIAANPTSAPALLLILPGLIASYVARPDEHGLTTRLLSSARLLLLGIALCAYVAAARVALVGGVPEGARALTERTESLESWLCGLTLVSAALFAGLTVTWMRGKRGTLARFSADRFKCSRSVAMSPRLLEARLGDLGSGCPLPADYTFIAPTSQGQMILTRSAWHGEWTLTLLIEDISGESLVSATLDYTSLLPASFALPLLRRREARRIVNALVAIANWARP